MRYVAAVSAAGVRVATVTLSLTTRPSRLVWINLLLVYFFWGSTYAGIAVAGESAPPFTSMSVRFVIASAAMAIILKFRKRTLAVTRRELGSAAFVGVALLACGTGGVALGEQSVPTGVTSLIICATPMWMILFRTVTGDRPKALGLVGAAIGFTGMFVLVASAPNHGLGGGFDDVEETLPVDPPLALGHRGLAMPGREGPENQPGRPAVPFDQAQRVAALDLMRFRLA